MKAMEKMREILEEMRQESLIALDTIAKKNTESMNVLLDTLCKEKFVEQAREIYLELKHYVAPNAHTFNILIHGWCNIRRLKRHIGQSKR
uniref:Uncharacterized protein n=1 Tax=Medicago truncatula TaxID=3880 RepID=A2Q2U0_MEDTR|nr:hypothetical protein MtrDRAFT_AC152184g38v2 [Medicago truncatula]